jgi:alkylation response protein AidB-like acyl-CoA dehydrogenase
MALPLYDHPAVERSWAWGEVAGMAIRSAILGSSLQAASCHAHQRYQGGKILVGHSLVRERLAELELLDEHLRSLWRHLARGEPGTARSKRELVAAALESATRVPRAVSEALQLFGGYGYMEDFGQAKRFRDAHQTAWLFGHAQQKRDSVFETGPERHIDTEARP